MNYVVNFFKKIKDKFTKEQKMAFVITFFVGVFSHAYLFFDSLMYHDNVYIKSLGATFRSGRWTLGLITNFLESTIKCNMIPFVNGTISILFISLAALFIFKMFNIKNKYISIGIGCLMVNFPVVTSTFAYMFTAPYYFMALFMNVFAIYLVTKDKHKIINYIISCLLIATAMGIYQAYFPVAVTLAVLILFKYIYDNNPKTFKEVLIKSIYLLSLLIVSLIAYFILNKVMLNIYEIQLTTYNGINDMGVINLSKIPKLIYYSYLRFLFPSWDGINNDLMVNIIFLFILIGYLVIFINILFKKIKPLNKFFMFALIAILPLAFNLIYLFSTSENYSVHQLMRYSIVFSLIFPLIIFDKIKITDKDSFIKKITSIILTVLYSLIIFMYIYINNLAYFKMHIEQDQTINYYNALIARIQSIKGYDDDMEIVWINSGNKKAEAFETPVYEGVDYMAYDLTTEELINSYSWELFMRYHNGFNPKVAIDTTEFYKMEEVKKMPCYPDDGSIKIIEDKIVVKFSEIEEG